MPSLPPHLAITPTTLQCNKSGWYLKELQSAGALCVRTSRRVQRSTKKERERNSKCLISTPIVNLKHNTTPYQININFHIKGLFTELVTQCNKAECFVLFCFVLFNGHTCGIWKFPGQGLNLCLGSDLSHGNWILNPLCHSRTTNMADFDQKLRSHPDDRGDWAISVGPNAICNRQAHLQYAWCPYKEGKFGHRGRYSYKEDDVEMWRTPSAGQGMPEATRH